MHLRRIAVQKPRLLGGKRRAQRGRHALHSELGQGHHIHVPLHQNDPGQAPGLAEQIGRKYGVALVEGRRIGGVEVLGHRIAHGASAEAQHVSVRVDDGEHGAVSEHVEGASLATEHQAGLNELLLGEALLHQPPADLRRGRGGADAEAADDRIRQPALLKVMKNAGSLRLPEQLVVHPCGRAVGQVDALLERSALFIGRVVLHLRQGHVKLLGQESHRLREGQALNVHHELDDAAAGLAAEAVIYLLLLVHGKGGRRFVVKRAQTNISMPVLLQRHIRADHLYDVGARPELVQPLRGVPSGHVFLHPLLFIRRHG